MATQAPLIPKEFSPDNEEATIYTEYSKLPYGQLETQLVENAMGDMRGLKVLDLGGGTGGHARTALDRGAAHVDVVDISPEILETGRAISREHGYAAAALAWHEADISQPLDQSLPQLALGSYDVVLVNGVIDLLTTVAQHEGLWRNVAAYLKPGGRFLGVRSGDPRAPCVVDGRYGMQYYDHRDTLPGGVRYRFRVFTTPIFGDEAASLECSFSKNTDIQERAGLCDIVYELYESCPVIRDDPISWKLFLENPSLVCVKGKRAI